MARKRKLYAIAKLNEISQQLEIDKDKALKKILEDGKKKLQEYVRVYWYNAYSPKQYDRTDEFFDCVDARFIGENEVEIFYDTDALQAMFGAEDNWNKHMGFDYSPFDGEGLIQMLEFGMNGGSTNNPRFGDSGAHGLLRLRAWLLTYVKKAVAESFK